MLEDEEQRAMSTKSDMDMEQETSKYLQHTTSLNRWNTNEEIASILMSVTCHPELITKNVRTRPPNGSLLLYYKKESNYKQDGYVWKKRKDGKLPREDHMRLKVKGVEAIYANYVHSALVPTFHRRSYWLLSSPDVVLVHYLNVPNESEQQNERILACLRQYGSTLSRQEILDQLIPMICSGEERPGEERPGVKAVSSHNISSSGSVKHFNWLNSLIDESQKPKLSGQRSMSSGGSSPPPGGSNYNMVLDYNGDDPSIRSLLASLNPSASPAGPSAKVILTAPGGSKSPASTGIRNEAGSGGAVRMPGNVRSNSCGSSHRKIICNLALRRQPSAFSDGAQDVFLPDFELRHYETPDDSAYCSYTDFNAKEPISDDARSRSTSDTTHQIGQVQNATAVGDPMLSSSANVEFSELNSLELSKEDINELMKIDLVGNVAQFDSENNFPLFGQFLHASSGEGECFSPSEEFDKPKSNNAEIRTTTGQVLQRIDDQASSLTSRRSSCNSATSNLTDNLRYCVTNADLAMITDFSPDWAYPEGGVKMLISGPWYSGNHRYTCKFDMDCVPAEFVQSGVLRCHCPPHRPGVVNMCVVCEDQVVSNNVQFVYREKLSGNTSLVNITPQFWIGANDNCFVNGLLERLYYIETHLSSPASGTPTSSGNSINDIPSSSTLPTCTDVASFECRLRRVVERMSTFDWHELKPLDQLSAVLPHHFGLTLLHICSALGYVRLLGELCKWQREKPSEVLKRELDPCKVDGSGRTPLTWACVKGHVSMAKILARWSRDSLLPSDTQNNAEPPLALAYRQGHLRLIKEVTEQFVADANGDPTGKDLDTALWVLTGGLVERSQLFAGRRTSSTDGQRRAKRSSLEGVDDLMRREADECTSCKMTKQDRQQSVHAVEEWLKQPLNVDIPLNLAPPAADSPGMAWETLTDDCDENDEVDDLAVGEEMASLAQEIIDALPDRIKSEAFDEESVKVLGDVGDMEDCCIEVDKVDNDNESASLKSFPSQVLSNVEPQLSPISPQPGDDCKRRRASTPMSVSDEDYFNYRYLDCGTPSSVKSPSWIHSPVVSATTTANFVDDCGSARCAECGNNSPLARALDLGAFFNAARSRSPLECHFQDLTLSDREQRELYEAAKVIQNAFRQYKKRVQSQRQIEMERQAATVIQTYYRRYKQYCYFKKLHQAAALIQKHFRLYKASKRRKSTGSAFSSSTSMQQQQRQDHCRRVARSKNDHNYDASSVFMKSSSFDCPMVDMPPPRRSSRCMRVQVTQEEMCLWKQQLAAIRIQHAFRGHIKRQAAARTIQRFMRQSKQKLQKARTTEESIAEETGLTISPNGFLNTRSID